MIINMRNKFTKDVKEIISGSAEEASRLGSPAITDGHLLLAMIGRPDIPAVSTLVAGLGLSPARLTMALESLVGLGPKKEGSGSKSIPLDRSAERVIRGCVKEATKLKSKDVGVVHILLALAADPANKVSPILEREGASYQRIREVVALPVGPGER